MIVHRISGIFRLQILIQCGILSLIYWIWYFVYGRVLTEGIEFSPYLNYWLVGQLAILLEALSRNPHDRTSHSSPRNDRRTGAGRQVLYLTAAVSVFLVMAKDDAISRIFLSVFIVAAFVALNYSQMILSSVLPQIIYRHRSRTRTLLVGSSGSVGSFQAWITEKRVFGLEIVGILSHDAGEQFEDELKVHYMGAPAQLEEVLVSRRADQVILLDSSEDITVIREMIRHCEKHGIRFALLNDLSEKMGRTNHKEGSSDINLVFLYEEPLEDPFNQMVKRIFDLIVASVAVVTVLPFACLLVKLIHLFQSRGPLIYTQMRTGINGKPFEIYKFRSLHATPHDEGQQVREEDDRVFSGGRLIRKLSIDELPQFLNVLRGEMSVIGPRPHFLEHDEYFAKLLGNYKTRALVKPGITGLAQIRGFRGNTENDVGSVQRRILNDIAYLEGWSLKLDFVILFKTVLQMFRPPKSAF
ncbi:MAG: exopolysaccharide biosynthesis polyprenyl glycosylphosphotransferase [Verrucomicrobiales bacterium]